MLRLYITPKNDILLRHRMFDHYSKPEGFVGRSICYSISYDNVYYGHIVGGSATRFLPGRNEYLGVKSIDDLKGVVNNLFYNISKVNDRYPCRNFTTKVLKYFMQRMIVDWPIKYGRYVIGFETLIEKPRTGELYKRAGWCLVGETHGYTCKRVAGKGTDSWSGKRVWNTDPDNLKPKIVLCYKI